MFPTVKTKIPLIISIFCLTSCVKDKIDDKCCLYNEAMVYFDAHHHLDYADPDCYLESAKLFEKAVYAGCEDFDLYYKLYYCYSNLDKYNEAVKYISKAIELDSSWIRLYYLRGLAKMKLKKLSQAELDFKIYVSRGGKDGYYNLGAIQFALGDTVNATINMAKAVNYNSGKEMRDFQSYDEVWGLLNRQTSFD